MYTHDLIVIGAGAGGLTAAGGCARLGLRVALIERSAMGGDCLNTGCVPSKALIAAAARAHALRSGAALGIAAVEPAVDFAAVHAHVHRAIAAIAPVDSAEHMTELGCEVIRGDAVLTGRAAVAVGDRKISAPRIVLAVGSRPQIPNIEGLADVPLLTNENVFALDTLPRHLLVVGNGPIGLELAQAFRRLGAEVTVAAPGGALPKDDAEAVAVALDSLANDGVNFIRGEVSHAASDATGVTLTLKGGETLSGSHVLLATGRSHDFAGLGLDAAGVQHDADGIVVDARRRTSNPRIYAIGDCRPGPHFTHVSGYEGANIVLEVGLGLPTKADYSALPWVTYTDPEVAQVGLTEVAARKRHGDTVRVWREDFADNDRAIAEGDTRGFVKLVKHGRKLVGATIVGAGAGDLILPAAMIVAGKSSLFGLASLIVPYPNRSENLKKAAFASQDALVFNRFTRGWAQLLARLRR
ncbi:FAD-binding protein [Polymorphobacter fuscus]|uniref:FAD-binding protein n=1 Tax=Sandarakinorhabdus fusca TaxID=1439888 RepID=A0A7C9KY17_9SPHN|nr:FAD-dependent oxidoreductase [Polymorphobacter fuscus]KAB7646617.1 FAD-binding protein [Polymorphobacter fuscus]MQT17726.1 FAD-binding protein [Polymorphobacter fuscus]